MRWTFLLVAAALTLASGCQGAPGALSAARTATEPTVPLQELLPGDPPVEGPGYRVETEAPLATFTLTIRWPARTAQAIPLSANTATVWLFDSVGRPLATQTVNRPTDGNLSSQVYFRLKAALGVRVVAKLYRELEPTVNSTPLALGQGTLDLWANNLNVLTLVLDPVVKPVISGFVPEMAGVGKLVEIQGAGFGSDGDDLLREVSFSAVPVDEPDISWVSDQTIMAVVPEGAVTGDVVLSVDGIRTVRAFQVIRSLDLGAFSLPLQAYRPLVLRAQATLTNGVKVADAPVDWESSDPAVADIQPDGLLRPLKPGTTTVVASSGQVRSEATVRVTTSGAVVVATVVVGPSSQTSVQFPFLLPEAASGNLPITVKP